jgi:hypothetical protein
MPQLKDLEQITQNSLLNSIFTSAIKRAAQQAIIDPNSTAQVKAWAQRAHFEFGVERSGWYATRVIEGALIENATFRNLIDAWIANPGSVSMLDQDLVAIVAVWVPRFAAAGF